jgi:hypothetical protein
MQKLLHFTAKKANYDTQTHTKTVAADAGWLAG